MDAERNRDGLGGGSVDVPTGRVRSRSSAASGTGLRDDIQRARLRSRERSAHAGTRSTRESEYPRMNTLARFIEFLLYLIYTCAIVKYRE